MTEAALPSLSSLPVEEALHVEMLCGRFEEAWKRGERPRAESYRQEVSATTWPALLNELLKLEMAYRLRHRELPTEEVETQHFSTRALPDVLAAADVPASFGDYERVKKVGHGGQAEVYRAWNRKLRRDEALKMLREPATPRDRARFSFEGEAAAALDHPNIVPMYGVDEMRGRPFLAMKWVEGQTLVAVLLAPERDLRIIVGLLAKAVRAVEHAHRRGILHRDLKPGNVLIDSAGEPYVADFGLARRLDAQPGQTSGEVAGTPAYMAPEQARGKQDLTTAVDVYGLGAILYEALTNRPPYQGAKVNDIQGAKVDDILRQVSEQAPPPPSSLKPAIDRDLEAVCLKCLERDPSRRYVSAEALARDLESWLRGEGVSARPPGMLNWVRQVWRTTPPLTTNLWMFLVWMGLITLATNGLVFAAVLLNGKAPWLWVASLARVGIVPATRFFRKTPLRLPGPRLRQSLIVSLGLMVVEISLAIAYLPFSASALARDGLSIYPPLAVACGLTYVILGSTYWGRLVPVGVGFIALAPVLVAWPDWSPLLFGLVGGVAPLWWAYCTRKYFGPQSADPAPRRI